MTAETEGVLQQQGITAAFRDWLTSIDGDGEVHLRIEGTCIDAPGDQPVVQGLQRDDRLNGTGTAEQVAKLAFRCADGNVIRC